MKTVDISCRACLKQLAPTGFSSSCLFIFIFLFTRIRVRPYMYFLFIHLLVFVSSLSPPPSQFCQLLARVSFGELLNLSELSSVMVVRSHFVNNYTSIKLKKYIYMTEKKGTMLSTGGPFCAPGMFCLEVFLVVTTGCVGVLLASSG